MQFLKSGDLVAEKAPLELFLSDCSMKYKIKKKLTGWQVSESNKELNLASCGFDMTNHIGKF
jgi:hypothetical protein